MDFTPNTTHEWLEADGLGGFASGTVSGVRTRRYHALLLTALASLPSSHPPAPSSGRVVLVNGFDAWVVTPAGTFALSSQLYTPRVIHPDGARRIKSYDPNPWPRWKFTLEDGAQIEQEIFVPRGNSTVALSWRVAAPPNHATLIVRPFFSGRDYHALQHENPAFQFEPDQDGERLVWHPYAGIPGIVSVCNGTYTHQPQWYREFLYQEEQARGLDNTEDLASPGTFQWDLSAGEAVWILSVENMLPITTPLNISAELHLKNLRVVEADRRRRFPSPLHRAADTYIVDTGRKQFTSAQVRATETNSRRTIIAGYPWFTDWGRDTFIAMRGLCLVTGRLDDAREILLDWAGTVSEGTLPNRFPDYGSEPEFNSVDASLWYVIAVYEFLQTLKSEKRALPARDEWILHDAIEAILSGYAKGTRFGIRLDDDGLLTAGRAGVQLTWMDAKIGEWVITPRIGKPIEVQALWLNALRIGSAYSTRWMDVFTRGHAAFAERFWNEDDGCLYDVIDCDHQSGKIDATFRPNQIFAVGGLPVALIEGARARRIIDAVEHKLWTPMGLRSLAPGEADYSPSYQGDVSARDGAYHQGTVWPWLIGPFIEAWVRVRGHTRAAKREARARYLSPLLAHLNEAGIGHVSEIADAEPPHTPRGCPFQAWSLGEVLRLSLLVLADRSDAHRQTRIKKSANAPIKEQSS